MKFEIEMKLSYRYKQFTYLILIDSLRCFKESNTMDMIFGKCKR